MIEKIFIEQGVKRVELEEFLKKELDRAGFTKSEIQKTPLVTRIIVNVTRPGLAIGKSGANIRQLTEIIHSRFGIENPQLEIKEITKPELDAAAMVNRLKALIERGHSWRSIAYRVVNDISMAGAQGVELVVSGKLTGKGGRKKRVRIAQGYMKKVGDQASLVDYAKTTAYPKPGAIGIKLKLVRPETIFPDKVNIIEIIRAKKAADFKAAKAQEDKKEEGAEAAEEGKTEVKAAEKKEEKDGKKDAEKKHEGKKEEKPAEKKHVEKAEHEKKAEDKKHGKKEEKAEKKNGKEKGKGKEK
ncbi:MAG: 30S ribosomal protein S3 [Candidatus Diapherotrites archaeon]